MDLSACNVHIYPKYVEFFEYIKNYGSVIKWYFSLEYFTAFPKLKFALFLEDPVEGIFHLFVPKTVNQGVEHGDH